MRNQFELDAEADPNKLIAITHYGTTSTNSQGETGFRVYLRNSSPREIQAITFHVIGYDKEGLTIEGIEQRAIKTLQFDQVLKSGAGTHPMWENAWKKKTSFPASIACAIIESAEITYTDGTRVMIPKPALDTMIYNPKCLSLDGEEYAFGTVD